MTDRFLIYQGPINAAGVRNAEILATEALREGVKRVVLFLCSGGGDVTSGIGLYNFLRALPLNVDTHGFGIIGSIAATIFLAGQRRTVTRTSMFTLHAASYVEGPKAGQVAENTALISLPFKEQLGWSSDELFAHFGSANETYLTAVEAVQLGIATELAELTLPRDAASIRHVSIPN